MSEKDIQKACLDLLNRYGLAVKHGAGAFKDNDRFIKMGAGFNNGNGWPECTFVYYAYTFLFEVKTPTGRLTDSQKIVFPELAKHQPIYILRDVQHALILAEFARISLKGEVNYQLAQEVANLRYRVGQK